MSAPVRLVIWGPGQLGGSVLRRALVDPGFEVVGVRVFSPSKAGVDVGELVGMDPVGVLATRSADEIFALAADCVVYTPLPTAGLTGMDHDVVRFLESGTSVVTTMAYFNATMDHWLSADKSATDLIAAVIDTTGPVPAPARVVTSLRPARAVARRLPLWWLGRQVDRVLEPVVARARWLPAERIDLACQLGGAAVHGTGLHPGFIVEQCTLTMAGLLDQPRRIHFVETGDLSSAPDGMWGGLESLGIGSKPGAVDANGAFGRGGDLYMRAVAGNVAHALFGVDNDALDITAHVRGVPSPERVVAGSTVIEPGRTGALHMTHTARLDGEVVYTNEERWYVGAPNAFVDDKYPFADRFRDGGYAMDIAGRFLRLKAQVEFTPVGELWPAVNDMSVNVIMSAIRPVSEGVHGIIVDDPRPHYRVAGSPMQPAPGQVQTPVGEQRVAVVGSGSIHRAVVAGAQSMTESLILVTASEEPDTVLVAGDLPPELDLAGLLASGCNVIVAGAIAPEQTGALAAACERGQSRLHAVGEVGNLLGERLVPVMARIIAEPHHVRFVESLDLATSGGVAADFGLTLKASELDPTELFAAADRRGARAVLATLCETAGANPTAVRLVHDVRAFTNEPAAGQREAVEDDAVTAVQLTRRAYVEERLVARHEMCAYLGEESTYRGDEQPIGPFADPACYVIQISGVRNQLSAQIALEPEPGVDPAAAVVARGLLDAAVAAPTSPIGLLTSDPATSYVRDDRVRRELS